METATANPKVKRFTTASYDKFKDRTDLTWKDPMKGKLIGKWPEHEYKNVVALNDGDDDTPSTTFTETLTLGMRYLETDDSSGFVLDYELIAMDWWFIRNGSVTVHLYNKVNISLEPVETDTEVFDGGKIRETGYCMISMDEMQQIASAESVEVRVAGSAIHTDLEPKSQLKFLFMVRSMLAEAKGETAYDAWIESIVPIGSESNGFFTQTRIFGIVVVVAIILSILYSLAK